MGWLGLGSLGRNFEVCTSTGSERSSVLCTPLRSNQTKTLFSAASGQTLTSTCGPCPWLAPASLHMCRALLQVQADVQVDVYKTMLA